MKDGTEGKTRKKRFSLVELLVVITVISILSSIMLPALAKARNHANDIACLSNLKQIGQGVLQYTGDYNGYVIPSNINSYGDEVSFMNYLYNTGKMKSKDVFLCPSVTEENEYVIPYKHNNPPATFENLDYGSYVMNTISKWTTSPKFDGMKKGDMDKYCRGWGKNSQASVKITKVKNFAQKFYIMDAIKRPAVVTDDNGWRNDMTGIVSWKETDHGQVPTSSSGIDRRDVGYHHRDGSFNVLFGDMHARNRRVSQIDEWVVWVK